MSESDSGTTVGLLKKNNGMEMVPGADHGRLNVSAWINPPQTEDANGTKCNGEYSDSRGHGGGGKWGVIYPTFSSGVDSMLGISPSRPPPPEQVGPEIGSGGQTASHRQVEGPSHEYIPHDPGTQPQMSP